MHFTRLKQTPVLIALAVLVLVCAGRMAEFEFFERLERITYDWRARNALHFEAPVADKLGFVYVDDDCIRAVKSGELGYRFGLYWPRQVYGRLVQELAAHNVETVAFDVLFGELRGDLNAPVVMADGSYVESDDYFAQTMKNSSNVLLAFTDDLPPPPLFATNAFALGDISTEKDVDGVLRRARAFHPYRRWHPAFRQAEAEYGVDLKTARFEPGRIVLTRYNPEEKKQEEFPIAVDAENNFNLEDFGAVPPGTPPKAKAYTEERMWHMGIVLAARHLKIDLSQAQVELNKGRITLTTGNGEHRVIPVDERGFFYIDWIIRPDDPRLQKESMTSLLFQNYQRLKGEPIPPRVDWTNQMIIVGSAAQGNDLTDRGATPLAKDTLLVGKHWNVANSVLTGRFVQRTSLATEMLLIVLLGIVTALLTAKLPALPASLSVLSVAVVYGAVCFLVYGYSRVWLPMVFPMMVTMVMEHVSLVTYRVVFEQRDKRRVKSIFSKVVAPEVMNELLRKKNLTFGGTRREVTVLFADVRGFTELTDHTQELVADFVREKQLSHDAAEACFDDFAAETLRTVNSYLTCVIDAATKERGTFDKLIGDCVMFFWGAPLSHDRHASACVRAAIEAQRAIYRLNQQRAIDNKQREQENLERQAAGLPPRPPLATLTLGTGINTGMVTAGIMGSDTVSVNYTVFGREVNLASRLEGMSGRGRIFISETTHQHLLRDDPALANTCIQREPMKPKGFNKPVQIYEVPWMFPDETPQDFQTVVFAKPQ